MVQRRQRNQLVRLKTEEGTLLQSEAAINDHLLHYFQNLLKAAGNRNFSEALSPVTRAVSEEMNLKLTRPVTEVEIKTTVFQMGSLKAPGPDGFQGIFYQTHWVIVGPEVCPAIQSFFNGNSLPAEWNHTNLVLIPKVMAPEKLTQYRPISLCNFKMKIIIKILASRLKSFLYHIISPNQAAFVPGRLIQDLYFSGT